MGAVAGGKWSNQAEYEALYGTQEQQAKEQVALVAEAGGPWRLYRNGRGGKIILPNSVRSTHNEIDRLIETEYARTEILWSVEKFTREQDEVTVSL